MRIGVPKESKPGERRVAATPKTVEQLIALGYAVFVEQGAGAEASFDDGAYEKASADLVDEAVWNADVILKINPPTDAEVARLRQVACPRCGSLDTEELAAFGSTACKALRRCRDCREPFDEFKPL